MSKLISFSLKQKKPVAVIIESKKFSKISLLNNTSLKELYLGLMQSNVFLKILKRKQKLYLLLAILLVNFIK